MIGPGKMAGDIVNCCVTDRVAMGRGIYKVNKCLAVVPENSLLAFSFDLF